MIGTRKSLSKTNKPLPSPTHRCLGKLGNLRSNQRNDVLGLHKSFMDRNRKKGDLLWWLLTGTVRTLGNLDGCTEWKEVREVGELEVRKYSELTYKRKGRCIKSGSRRHNQKMITVSFTSV